MPTPFAYILDKLQTTKNRTRRLFHGIRLSVSRQRQRLVHGRADSNESTKQTDKKKTVVKEGWFSQVFFGNGVRVKEWLFRAFHHAIRAGCKGGGG